MTNKDDKAPQEVKSKAPLTKKKALTGSVRAGLVFPVGRMHRYLKKSHDTQGLRISQSSAVYLASVLEYLCSEVLELSGNAASDNKKKRLNPRHIMLAVQKDSELQELLKNVTIPGAGVVPAIHSILLPRRSDKPTEKSSSSASMKTK